MPAIDNLLINAQLQTGSHTHLVWPVRHRQCVYAFYWKTRSLLRWLTNVLSDWSFVSLVTMVRSVMGFYCRCSDSRPDVTRIHPWKHCSVRIVRSFSVTINLHVVECNCKQHSISEYILYIPDLSVELRIAPKYPDIHGCWYSGRHHRSGRCTGHRSKLLMVAPESRVSSVPSSVLLSAPPSTAVDWWKYLAVQAADRRDSV